MGKRLSPAEERASRHDTKALQAKAIAEYRECAALKDTLRCHLLRSTFPVLTNVFNQIDKGVTLYESYKSENHSG